jgi:hypothetical protein
MLLLVPDALIALLATSVVFSSVFVTLRAWKGRWEKRKQAETGLLGRELGLSAVPDHSLGLTRQLQAFDLFARERSSWFRNGRVTNILRGQINGTDMYLFDYTYVVSTGKSSHRITQTVFFANDKDWYLPDFRLKPETWWHKILAAIGWESDINFSESPEFSEKFRLTSEFEELIRKQFTPDLQAFLTERPPTHIEGSNYYLIAYKPNKVLSPEDARVFFKHCCDLVVMLKKEGKMELLDLAELKNSVKSEVGNSKVVQNLK